MILNGVAIAFPLLLLWIFDIGIIRDFAAVMSLSFLVTVPFGIGVLTITLSPEAWVRKGAYPYLMPLLPVFLFCLITLIFGMEGWACWIIVMPVFFVFASLGGAVAAALKLRKRDKLNICLALLLPFAAAPLENLLEIIPATYSAYTSIDIKAPAGMIWENVLRVKEISEEEDHGTLTNFLGFPRPVKAELDTGAVGGRRRAIFSKGLVFDEVVTRYKAFEKMSFTIKADPYKIPSAAMDEHVVIGGKYFDVLDGNYELEALGNGRYRLHLYSHFEMRTTFNFYAGWWARWIMRDIQENILQVIKTRCEKS